MFDQVFWVGVSFVTFLVLVYRPVSRALTQTLDARAAQISKELEEAVRLREEAQATLAIYQQKHAEITREAESILAHAKTEAARMRDEAKVRIEQSIATRTARAEEKIAQEEAKAVASVQQQVADIALRAAQEILTTSMQSDADAHLMDAALSKIATMVH